MLAFENSDFEVHVCNQGEIIVREKAWTAKKNRVLIINISNRGLKIGSVDGEPFRIEGGNSIPTVKLPR